MKYHYSTAGSGVLPSEPNSGVCTCEHQPDNVKVRHDHDCTLMMLLHQVIIAKHGSTAQDKAASDQKLRELRTLKAHYYPEGGWGWVILTVSSLVHLLVIGAQVSRNIKIFY